MRKTKINIENTRGIRNNNPLNIRHSASRWQGMRVEQTDKEFVQFESMAMGYRAAWRVLETYWSHFLKENKPFSVKNIIHRWAPPAENDSEAYVRTVCRLSGLGGQRSHASPKHLTHASQARDEIHGRPSETHPPHQGHGMRRVRTAPRRNKRDRHHRRI